MEGVEPTTPRLQITCSSQLSYIGKTLSNSKRDCKDRYLFLFSKTFLFFLPHFVYAPHLFPIFALLCKLQHAWGAQRRNFSVNTNNIT